MLFNSSAISLRRLLQCKVQVNKLQSHPLEITFAFCCLTRQINFKVFSTKIASEASFPCQGIREIFPCGIRDLWPWNLEYSSRNPKSYQRLESRIQLSLTDTGQVFGIRNPRTSWIPLYREKLL